MGSPRLKRATVDLSLPRTRNVASERVPTSRTWTKSRSNRATRRKNGRHINQVLLLDIRVAQGELECGEGMAMDADTLGQEHTRWTGEHVSPSFICRP